MRVADTIHMMLPNTGLNADDPKSRVLDRIVVFGISALLMFGVLAFGAVENWAICVIEIGAVALFLVWTTRQIATGTFEIIPNPVYGPMLAFAGLLIVQIAFGLNAYRFQSVFSGFEYVAYGILLVLVVNCLKREADDNLFWSALTVFGFALSVFAIIQSLTSKGALYWHFIPPDGGLIYGPYVNRNHYAGLLEMLTPIPLVMCLRNDFPVAKRVLIGFAGVVMASTIFLSQSRGGIIAFVIELLVLGLALGWNRKSLFAVGTVAALLIAMLLWIGVGPTIDRLETLRHPLTTEPGSRYVILTDSVKMFVQKPVLGWGLGNFPLVHPQFRSYYTNQFVNQAHNDYLQVLIEMGLLGFAVVVWFLVVVLRSAIRRISGWQHEPRRALRFAALIGIVGILVHSFTDFNLQIPANAAMFYVLCGIAVRRSNGLKLVQGKPFLEGNA